MKVTYYALQPMQVGDEVREMGDLLPEAQDWKWRQLLIKDGKIAPVLVATLPRNVQERLNSWEKEQEELAALMEQERVEAEARREAELVQQSIEANTMPPSEDEGDEVEGKVTIRRGS